MRTHCSDIHLVAFLDGELPFWRRHAVRRHLENCWKCRARLSELELEAESFARLLREDHFVPLGRWLIARRSLVSRMDSSNVHAPALFTRHRARAAMVLAAAVLPLSFMLLPRFASPGPAPSIPPTPAAILMSAQTGEAPFLVGYTSIEQVLDVDLNGAGADRPIHGRLIISSDPSQQWSALRWESGGRLKYGVSTSGPGRSASVKVDPSLKARLSKVPAHNQSTLADLNAAGLDAEGMEVAFLNWLQANRWRPIALASDFATFAARKDVSLGSDEAAEVTGNRRLRAVRRTPHESVVVTLETGSGSASPRLAVIRFASVKGQSELRLRLVRASHVPRRTFSAFTARSGPAPSTLAPPPEVEFVPAIPSAATLPDAIVDSAEVAAWYELHKSRTCLGEPVVLDRLPGGRLRLHGAVRTRLQMELLAAAVIRASAPLPVSVELRSFDEEAGGLLLGAENVSTIQPLRAQKLPLEADLIRYFRSSEVERRGTTPAAAATAFANTMIASSQRSMGHAWALRRLLARFPASRIDNLDRRGRYLLETMVRDHLASLWSGLAEMKSDLEPVLRSLVPDAFKAPQTPPDPHGETYEHVFESMKQIDEQLRYLFAGELNSSGAVRPSELVLRLSDEFQRLQTTFVAFESNRERNLAVAGQSGSATKQ